MKILSVRQPWATLIVNGHKDVENRTWRTLYRGQLLVHAALRADDVTSDEIERRYAVQIGDDLPRGGVVGVVEVVDCVRDHPSRWAQSGHWHFVLRNSRPIQFTPWKGAL